MVGWTKESEEEIGWEDWGRGGLTKEKPIRNVGKRTAGGTEEEEDLGDVRGGGNVRKRSARRTGDEEDWMDKEKRIRNTKICDIGPRRGRLRSRSRHVQAGPS